MRVCVCLRVPPTTGPELPVWYERGVGRCARFFLFSISPCLHHHRTTLFSPSPLAQCKGSGRPAQMGAPTSPTAAPLLHRAASPSGAAATRRRSSRLVSSGTADGGGSSPPAPPPPPLPPRRRRSLIAKLGQSWNPTGIALFGRVLLVRTAERERESRMRPLFDLDPRPSSLLFMPPPLPSFPHIPGRLRPAGPTPPLHSGRRMPGLGCPEGRRLHGRRLRQGQHADGALLGRPDPGRRGRRRGRRRRLGAVGRGPALQFCGPGPVRPGRRGGGGAGGRPGRGRHPARVQETGRRARRARGPFRHPPLVRALPGHGRRPVPDGRGVRQPVGVADGAAGARDGGGRAPGSAAGEFFVLFFVF